MKKHILAVSIAALSIGGCTTFTNVSEINKDVGKKQVETQRQIQQVQQQPGKRERETVRYLNQQWVSLKPITLKDVSPSQSTSLRCRFKNLATNEPVTILEFGQLVTKECGIPVRVTPDALDAIDNPLSGDSGASSVDAKKAAPTVPPPPGMYPGVQATAASGDNRRLVDINYKGELPGLLDMVTARFGLSWKEEEGRIKIYNLDTETFHLHALASDTDMRSEMQSGTTMVNGGGSTTGGTSGGGSSGGNLGGTSGTNQNTVVAMKASMWKDLQTTVESMRSGKGRVAVSPSMGTVTVTDNSDVLSRVRSYVDRENTSLTKQVLFNIKVVSVTVNDTDSAGISWAAVYQSLSGKYGFKLTSAFAAPSNAVAGAFSILQNSGSQWAGTDAIVNALSEQANVSIVKEPTASTLNLQPVAVQVARQDGFIAGTSTTTTAQVGSSTALQTGMITTGFNMSLLPYVMQDNRMLLQFSINLSNLRNLRQVREGNAIAELPEVDLPVSSTQKVRLSPGDTLMLTGFDQEDQSATRTGSFTPGNVLFGGGVNAKKSKSTLIVLITPLITE